MKKFCGEKKKKRIKTYTLMIRLSSYTFVIWYTDVFNDS